MLPMLTRSGGGLALRFPSGALRGSGAVLAAALAEEGFLVGPGADARGTRGARGVESWKFEAFEQEGETAILVGPVFEGASLEEAANPLEGLESILAVARAFAALKAAGSLPRGIVSAGLLVGGSGAGAAAATGTAAGAAGTAAAAADRQVLVLPPTAASRALAARSPEERAASVARLASPRAKDAEADASFLLAQAVYRFAAGKGAFEREAADKGGIAAARRGSASLALAAPRLHPALAALVDAALDEPGAAALDAWVAALEAARAAGWERELSPAESAEAARRLAAAEADAARKSKREAFFRKRGGLLVGALVALVLGGFLAADLIQAQRDKPDFSGLPPLELTRRYYAAVDGLDLDSLEACGAKAAIKADRDVVMNLYVLTRTRTAYEGRNPLLPARQWIAAGKGNLKESEFLYGIVDLGIEEIDEGAAPSADARRYRATYSIWSLDRVDPPTGEPSEGRMEPREERRVDELSLARGKRGWRIVSIERIVLP
jgi:hypothetical protein